MQKHISLTKQQVLSHNYIEVLWKDNEDINVDLFAILLDKEDKLIEDGDFVFYNSESRTSSFDPEKWHNRHNWRNSTLPMSVDGSVYAIGEPIDDEDEYWGEGMFIDLFRTRPKIHKIKFILAVYDDTGSRTLHGVKSIKVRIKQHESSETIYSSDISDIFEDDKVISLCTLKRNSEDNWSVSEDIIGYNNLQIFLDNFIVKSK